MFIIGFFTITKLKNQSPSADEWIRKMWVHSGILFNFKKEMLSFVTTLMELENLVLSKIIQTKKDKSHMCSLIHRF